MPWRYYQCQVYMYMYMYVLNRISPTPILPAPCSYFPRRSTGLSEEQDCTVCSESLLSSTQSVYHLLSQPHVQSDFEVKLVSNQCFDLQNSCYLWTNRMVLNAHQPLAFSVLLHAMMHTTTAMTWLSCCHHHAALGAGNLGLRTDMSCIKST